MKLGAAYLRAVTDEKDPKEKSKAEEKRSAKARVMYNPVVYGLPSIQLKR